MYEIYEKIAENSSLLWFLLIMVSIVLFCYLYKNRYLFQKKKKNDDDNDLPSNIWFYYQLINIEFGEEKPTYQNLLNSFLRYLYRKYRIKVNDLKTKTVFEIVQEKETDPEWIELYGIVWNGIEELKQSHEEEVIKYIKTIKHYFKKDNINEWISQTRKEKPCNNC